MKQIANFKLFMIAFFAAFYIGASAQSQDMSLEACIQYAMDNHPNIKVANLQIAEARWRVKESTAGGLPQVTAGLSYNGFIQRGGLPSSALSFGSSGPITTPQTVTDNFSTGQIDGLQDLLGSIFQSDPDSKIFFNPVHSVSGNIQASQLIFNNSYLLAIKAARYYDEYVREQLAAAKQMVRNQVTDAYLPALLIAENLNIIDKNLGVLEKIYSDTKAINTAGFAEQLDVDRLELSLSNLRSERSNLDRQREIVVNYLKLAMGMPNANNIALTDNLNTLLNKYADPDLTSAANFMNRPEYTALLKGRQLSSIQVDLYRKTLLPTIAGFVQYQGGFQGGFGEKGTDAFKKWYFIPSAIAGVSVNFTLWDSGVNKAKKERAIIGVQTIEAQKLMLENLINTELENARKQYINAKERVASAQKNAALAQRIYDTTQKKYKAGIGSSFEITQAESGLYAAQQSILTAQHELITAAVAIKKSMGGN